MVATSGGSAAGTACAPAAVRAAATEGRRQVGPEAHVGGRSEHAGGWVPAGPAPEPGWSGEDGTEQAWFDDWSPRPHPTRAGGHVLLGADLPTGMERAGEGTARGAAARPGAADADFRVPSWVVRCREGLADRVPPGWRRVGRTVPGRAAIAALALALAVSAGILARAMLTRPDTRLVAPPALSSARGSGATAGGSAPGPAPASGGVAGAGAAGSGSGQPGPGPAAAGQPGSGQLGSGQLVVDVVGRVRHRGLVRLAVGARVADAVAAAGGASPGAALDRINLARLLQDGEQVLVPGPNDVLPAAGGAGVGASTAGTGAGGTTGTGEGGGAVLDLNTASESQLDGLPGIGPVLAGRIVAWRAAHGRFSSVDELGEVAGIGPKLLERLRPLVRV